MKVLSLFDGISCGMIALERAGIEVERYVAYEIDENAIKVSMHNYPQIEHCGDVTKADFTRYKGFDVVIGGSPCQDLSISNNNRKGLSGERSILFWEFVRALKEVQPKYFLLENNYGMPKEAKETITKELGVEPILINSSLFSAQNRKRYYWTNIDVEEITDKNICITDILEDIETDKIGVFKNCIRKNVVEQYDDIISSDKDIYALKCSSGWQDNKVGLRKSPTLRAGNSFCLVKNKNDCIRLITIKEAERLQTLPENYTDGIAKTQRFKAIGNGWTVDVIAHIFKGLR